MTTYYGIMCLCGSRRTKRVGERLYQCQAEDCGLTTMLFVGREGIFTLPLESALSLERERRMEVSR